MGRAADRLRVGEPVTVKVLGDRRRPRQGDADLKALEGDPWVAVAGPAARAGRWCAAGPPGPPSFGVFVEGLPSIDGLLHVSEIPRHRQVAMREAVAGGTEILVMIVGIDSGKRAHRGGHAEDGDRSARR